jgi:hypothetical protein
MPEFKEIVSQSWVQPAAGANKARTVHIKLARLAKTLKCWHWQKMLDNTKEYTEAQWLVLRLDQLQDQRELMTAKFQSRKEAKDKILGIAAVKNTEFDNDQDSHGYVSLTPTPSSFIFVPMPDGTVITSQRLHMRVIHV